MQRVDFIVNYLVHSDCCQAKISKPVSNYCNEIVGKRLKVETGFEICTRIINLTCRKLILMHQVDKIKIVLFAKEQRKSKPVSNVNVAKKLCKACN